MSDNLEQEIQELRDRLLKSEKMAALGELIAGVAHEINTPLGALKSNNDMSIRAMAKIRAILGDSADTAEVTRLLDNLANLDEVNKTALDRIVRIVGSLRNFARTDAEPVDFNIHDGLNSTLTLVHHKTKDRITVHKDYGDAPIIKGYPNKLNQVFLNVLVNACQAIQGNGDLYIKTTGSNGAAVIEIRDTGIGIPKENLERVFEPGFTTKGAGHGTGLGLSIVSQIIEEHKGRINIESEEGKGTTVRIELPVS